MNIDGKKIRAAHWLTMNHEKGKKEEVAIYQKCL
jgi:hypothetical protein